MAKTSNPPPKQKNLFSFFSKKEKAPSPPSAASAPAPPSSVGDNPKSSAATNDTAAASTSQQQQPPEVRKGSSKLSAQQRKLLSKVCVGTKLAVYWPDDNDFYACVVHEHRTGGKEHSGHVYRINYDDGETEVVDLATERFKIIGGKKRSSAEGEEGNGKSSAENSDDVRKRRRILESSEEEFDDEDSEDEGDDSGSEFKAGDDDSMDESLDAESEKEDDWLASDDDEEEAPKKRKVVKKKVTVTRVGGSTSSKKITPTPMKPSSGKDERKTPAGTTEAVDFSSFASQSPVPFGGSAKKPAATTSSKKVVSQSQPSPMVPKKLDSQQQVRPGMQVLPPPGPEERVPMYSKEGVNPGGSHIHNHLKFFTTNRRDLAKRPVTHPDYSPRTLHVDFNELGRHGKVSPAQQQWWEIKSEYADTVLLFKTGKFYEMFHDDADVGVSVLGHAYMKGAQAHSGFPEGAYSAQLGKLVEAGYKVARVEQTETPDGLKERNKAMPKGQKKDKVVCREVCGIVTKGTRTFCYLDDVNMLEKGETSTGPLVAIKEVLVEDNAMDEDGAEESEAGSKAVYEYGVTIVDAITGVVTLGQFADNVLRSRLLTLLSSFGPSEVLYEGGQNTEASKTLASFLRSACSPGTLIQAINKKEKFPKSTAVNPEVRKTLERAKALYVQPWNGEETVKELHRSCYYPRSSRNNVSALSGTEGIARWPEILRRCIEGGATLAMSSFGAALYILQRSLVDAEILSMGIVKAYAPPNTGMDSSESASSASASASGDASSNASSQLQDMHAAEAREKGGMNLVEQEQPTMSINFSSSYTNNAEAYEAEANIDHLALDGTTLSNLEILHNITSGSHQGSLLSKIDATQSPHGSRLLRAWLLRPMFRKADIDRRADAVEELASGSAAVCMEEARGLLKKTGDIERLLSRVHSMGGAGQQGGRGGDENGPAAAHPNERAILYEVDKHTKRKVGDFSKLLNGLRSAADIPDLFVNADIGSPMLAKIVRTTDEGGCFPAGMKERLDWFFDNFDLKKAMKGEFEPSPGMDEEYDAACAAIEDIKQQLNAYKDEMCASELHPRHTARSSWKYINLKEDSKDKYLIELSASVDVPGDFIMKGKRGKGDKQVNKYRTPEVEQMVKELERAIEIKSQGKAAGMKLVFAKFDSMRNLWMAAAQATAMLDALGSLAHVAVRPGFTRPTIVDCPPSAKPGVAVVQGRHPCVDTTHSGGDFIPNDLVLGSKLQSDDDAFVGESGSNNDDSESNCLLLSGPNMGGKSTLLRQTCLITILAQMGSYVPAEQCALTPVDRIFTRLGASDRILCGQSTFFVELAETAAAVRGATRRSLVIMDELGRGTSTFDGTAIASATVKHLVETNGCLTLFATHYHSLLEDWKNEPSIKLGHMECIVEEEEDSEGKSNNNITFLYTLGDGPCPKSFGVNVARLAGLPDDVLQRAKRLSSEFEAEMSGPPGGRHKIIPATAEKSVDDICKLLSEGSDLDSLKKIWSGFQ